MDESLSENADQQESNRPVVDEDCTDPKHFPKGWFGDRTDLKKPEDQCQFKPLAYLRDFYDVDDLEPAMKVVLLFMPNIALRLPDGLTSLLEIGSGPTIHIPMIFRNKFKEVYMSDFSFDNVAELKAWRSGNGGYDWSPVVKYLANFEHAGETPEAMEDITRRLIKGIYQCDIRREGVLLFSEETNVDLSQELAGNTKRSSVLPSAERNRFEDQTLLNIQTAGSETQSLPTNKAGISADLNIQNTESNRPEEISSPHIASNCLEQYNLPNKKPSDTEMAIIPNKESNAAENLNFASLSVTIMLPMIESPGLEYHESSNTDTTGVERFNLQSNEAYLAVTLKYPTSHSTGPEWYKLPTTESTGLGDEKLSNTETSGVEKLNIPNMELEPDNISNTEGTTSEKLKLSATEINSDDLTLNIGTESSASSGYESGDSQSDLGGKCLDINCSDGDTKRSYKNYRDTRQFDVVCTVYCVEAACISDNQFENCMRNVCDKIRPGGYLIMGAVLYMPSFSYDYEEYRCYSLSEDQFLKTLEANDIDTSEDKCFYLNSSDIAIIMARKRSK